MAVDTFWLEVSQAYLKVAANHELTVEVARDGKYALVEYAGQSDSPSIVVTITEVDTHVTEVLPVP